MANHPFHRNPAPRRRPQRGAGRPWVFFGFLAVAGFFYFTEHRAHLMGALPFLLLALCPLMHLFHGHGGHGAHQGHGAPEPDRRDAGDGGDSPGSTPEPPNTPRAPHQH